MTQLHSLHHRLTRLFADHIFKGGEVICHGASIGDLVNFVDTIAKVAAPNREPQAFTDLYMDICNYYNVKDHNGLPEGCDYPGHWTNEENRIFNRELGILRKEAAEREGAFGDAPFGVSKVREMPPEGPPMQIYPTALSDALERRKMPPVSVDAEGEGDPSNALLTRAPEPRSMDMGDRELISDVVPPRDPLT